jgi:hypothetical protein
MNKLKLTTALILATWAAITVPHWGVYGFEAAETHSEVERLAEEGQFELNPWDPYIMGTKIDAETNVRFVAKTLPVLHYLPGVSEYYIQHFNGVRGWKTRIEDGSKLHELVEKHRAKLMANPADRTLAKD